MTETEAAVFSKPKKAVLKGGTTELQLACTPDQSRCQGRIKETLFTLNVLSPDFPALKEQFFTFSSSQAEELRPTLLRGAWIDGRDMFMGTFPLRIRSGTKAEQHTLSGTVPVCVTGSEMIWRLSILLEHENTVLLAYADLKTLHN